MNPATRTTFDRREAGFSFIELLAYIAIAALLILAAIPQFSAYREKALISNLRGDVHNASLAAEASLLASKRGASSSGGISLASTSAATVATDDASGLAAITAAVAATKTSDARSSLTVAERGAGEYRITGSNPATKVQAVYSSRTDGAFAAGLNMVDADGKVVGSDGSAGTEPVAEPEAPEESEPEPELPPAKEALTIASVRTGGQVRINLDKTGAQLGAKSVRVDTGTCADVDACHVSSIVPALTATYAFAGASGHIHGTDYFAVTSYVDDAGVETKSAPYAFRFYGHFIVTASDVDPISGTVLLTPNAGLSLESFDATSAEITIGGGTPETVTSFPYRTKQKLAAGTYNLGVTLKPSKSDAALSVQSLNAVTMPGNGPYVTNLTKPTSAGLVNLTITKSVASWAPKQAGSAKVYVEFLDGYRKSLSKTEVSVTATSATVTRPATAASVRLVVEANGATYESIQSALVKY